MGTTNDRRLRAFTLAEMLVVIGVISVLAAMLMPAVTSARKHAIAATCASQMRQVYAAVVAYANDNHGRVPKPPPLSDNLNNDRDQTGSVKKENFAWVMSSAGVANFEIGTFVNYLGPNASARQRLMTCPADPGYAKSAWFLRPMWHNFTYAFNAFMNRFYTDGPALPLTMVRNPAQKVMIWEQRAPYDGLVCYCMGYTDSNDKLPDWHFGMSNMVFADGHVELRRPAKTQAESDAMFLLTDNGVPDCGSHFDKASTPP